MRSWRKGKGKLAGEIAHPIGGGKQIPIHESPACLIN
jgi:hypothetical protein